jgi:hypothetical protein
MSFSASPPPPPRGLRDLRYQVGLLREFERWGGTWRGAVALVRLGSDQAVPVAAAVVIALVTVNGRIAQTALSATLALVVNGTTKSLRQKFPWHRPVTSRLALWETVNPRSMVPVLVTEQGVAPAFRALRSAGFAPFSYVVRHGIAPPDAPELEHEIKVHEPQAFARSASDEDRTCRIAAALHTTGVRARVAGIDVLPRRPQSSRAPRAIDTKVEPTGSR